MLLSCVFAFDLDTAAEAGLAVLRTAVIGSIGLVDFSVREVVAGFLRTTGLVFGASFLDEVKEVGAVEGPGVGESGSTRGWVLLVLVAGTAVARAGFVSLSFSSELLSFRFVIVVRVVVDELPA
jgi:hypothetical protein